MGAGGGSGSGGSGRCFKGDGGDEGAEGAGSNGAQSPAVRLLAAAALGVCACMLQAALPARASGANSPPLPVASITAAASGGHQPARRSAGATPTAPGGAAAASAGPQQQERIVYGRVQLSAEERRLLAVPQMRFREAMRV